MVGGREEQVVEGGGEVGGQEEVADSWLAEGAARPDRSKEGVYKRTTSFQPIVCCPAAVFLTYTEAITLAGTWRR